LGKAADGAPLLRRGQMPERFHSAKLAAMEIVARKSLAHQTGSGAMVRASRQSLEHEWLGKHELPAIIPAV